MVYATDPYLEAFAEIRAIAPPTDGEDDVEYCKWELTKCIINPSINCICCLRANRCKERAYEFVERYFYKNKYWAAFCDGNAGVHSFTACCIAKNCDASWAKMIMDKHENKPCACFDNCANTTMDYHNNQAGIDASRKECGSGNKLPGFDEIVKCCEDAVEDAHKNGDLITDWTSGCCNETSDLEKPSGPDPQLVDGCGKNCEMWRYDHDHCQPQQ